MRWGKFLVSLLHQAAAQGHDQVVAELLALDPALIGNFDRDGKTALHYAAIFGHEKIVAQLLTQCPTLADSVTTSNKTALHFAAQEGHTHIVTQLIACSPQIVDVKSEFGWTALHVAAQAGQVGVVELLLEHKPALVYGLDPFENTLLHRLLGLSKDLALLSEALVLKVWGMHMEAVFAANKSGRTPFHAALASGNFWAIDLILCKLTIDEIIRVFQISPSAPAAPTTRTATPFSAAIASIDSIREKQFFDFVARQYEELVLLLSRDVVGVVAAYLGAPKRPLEAPRTQRKDIGQQQAHGAHEGFCFCARAGREGV